MTPTLTPAELAERMNLPTAQRPILLDVRRPEEHALVAIPGSVLIPLQELGEHVDQIDAWKDRTVVVYCHHGMRSVAGAAFVAARGVDALSLAGGIDRYAVEVDPSLRRY